MRIRGTMLAGGALLGCAGLLLTAPTPAVGQGGNRPDTTQHMDFEAYQPRSTLVVPESRPMMSRFPFIDVHSHHWRPDPAYLERILADMDGLNMAVAVNLSGGTGGELASRIEAMNAAGPGRFIVFANIDFEGIGRKGWTEQAVRRLEEDVANGARGLKIFKNLGLGVTDVDGKRVPTNDPRLDPIWARAGELGIPVLIHTGDPAPFWDPQDEHNERWLELKERPGRKREADDPAPWEVVMGEQHDVFRKHPGTIFINAHLGWLGHDLGRLGRMMDEMPNMYTEIGAVLAEIGRQPRFARQFFIDYQDRILFGKDSWEPDEYRVYFRVLETADEYFDYYRRRHAFWKMYGLELPDEVLKKVYYENALRIIPGIDAMAFPR